MKKAIALAVCASFMFSSVALAADSVTLKQGNVDVVAAATSWTPAPAPAPKPAPKPATPKAPAAAPVKADGTLKLGSKGTAVKDLQTKLNANGYKLVADGIFGKLTLAAVKDYQTKNGLTVNGIVGPEMMTKLNAPAAAPAPVATNGKTTIKLGRSITAPHGTKSFADTVVVLAGDKIVAASIDEYQFMAKATNKGVPNSDADFGKNYANPEQVLGSKLVNAVAYSANMATKAGSTVSIDKNLAAIQDFAKGKTVAELEGILAKNTKEQMVDVVSGATLADTHGYLTSIVAAAKAAKPEGAIELDAAAVANLKLGRAITAPHGTKSFADTVVVMDGYKIVGASIDEYQFMAKATTKGVPNSDADFGKNYANPEQVLGSKLVNAAAYSANMATKAGSTVSIDKNLDAIENYAIGKTVAVLEGTLSVTAPEKMVDVVSGATLADTHGYLTSIVAAAKAAEPKVDVVSAATEAIVTDEATLLKGISKDGAWIVIFDKDYTVDKELVLDGQFKDGDVVARKLALYTQDEKRTVTARFKLKAPKLTVKSENAKIQGGTFIGDVYVEAKGFKIVDAVVEGNVYFANEEVKSTFAFEKEGKVTGDLQVK